MAKERREQRADVGIVFDEQDRAPGPSLTAVREGAFTAGDATATSSAGSSTCTEVPEAGAESIHVYPTALLHDAVDHREPQAAALRLVSFVVKNGSNACATVSGSIPLPVSRTVTITQSPRGIVTAEVAGVQSSIEESSPS